MGCQNVSMASNSIVMELRQLARHGQLASKEQWMAFREYMEKSQPCFYIKVNDRRTGLTYQEIDVCLLIHEGFIPQEIAVLLDVSQQRITDLRANINRKLFGQHGARNLEKNLAGFGNSVTG